MITRMKLVKYGELLKINMYNFQENITNIPINFDQVLLGCSVFVN